jgi:hypothetical protein
MSPMKMWWWTAAVLEEEERANKDKQSEVRRRL